MNNTKKKQNGALKRGSWHRGTSRRGNISIQGNKVLSNLQNLVNNYFEKDNKNDSKTITIKINSDPIEITEAKNKKLSTKVFDDKKQEFNFSKFDNNFEKLYGQNLNYDQIDCSKLASNLNQNQDCFSYQNSSDFDSTQRKILISEKLTKTKRIWYLPHLGKSLIHERLKNKPLGNFIISGSLDGSLNSNKENELVLYKSNNKSKISEYKINMDQKDGFSFKNDPSLKFKSLVSLLEYYIINNYRSKKLKLSLPNAINEANNFKALNSLSLLEQDFWLNEFYYKTQYSINQKNSKTSLDYLDYDKSKNKTSSSSLPQISQGNFGINSTEQTKSLNQLENFFLNKRKLSIKQNSSLNTQRNFYDPRFNRYSSPLKSTQTLNFGILKFFKTKKSIVNKSASITYEKNEKNSKASDFLNHYLDSKKVNNNSNNNKNSELYDISLTNLSGTLSNSKSLHDFDCLSTNSCLSFLDMIDTNKNLIETYSTIPNTNSSMNKIKIENRKTNIFALYSNSNNEYSEPFDLITSKKDLKKPLDDDSAYSSCYQSNLSSPKCNKVKIILTEEETVNDSLESSCSSSAQLSNCEYESVKDVVVNNDKDLFKSTITAFDILTERCSELMELFDSDQNCESKKTIDLKRKLYKYQKSKTQETNHLDNNTKKLLSNFIQRNLTFDFYMKSSSLLSSSISLSSSSNSLTDKFNSVRNLIIKMSKNEKLIFGKNIQEFIKCTLGLKEINPFLLMSNTRQFMNGIKNFLLKNDCSNIELKLLLEKERANLEPGNILNIDCLIEDCLQSIILQPLKAKIYYLMVDWFISDSSMVSLKHNMNFINELTTMETCTYLNLDSQYLPDEKILKQLRNYYNRMQCEYAPFIKLKYVIFILNDLVQNGSFYDTTMLDFEYLDSKKLLSLIIFALSKCRMYAIQIEIEYIWSLINKSLLSHETFYYLTLMSCACQALVGINCKTKFDFNKYLAEILYVDDAGREIRKCYFPVRNGMKCKDVAPIIAAKFKSYNQNEYGLYVYESEEFNKMKDDERFFEYRLEKIKSDDKFQLVYKHKLSNILFSKLI